MGLYVIVYWLRRESEIDRKIAGLKANYVGVDDEEVGRMATEHLIACGCRSIAHIRGPRIATAIGRLAGYRKALKRHGLTAPANFVTSGGYEDGMGYKSMRRLLVLATRPDGVFCFNDPVAAGAVKAILEAGLKIPADIAVVGVGNVHYSDLLRVPLSTVDQSSAQVGRNAAELLLQLIEKRARGTRTILIPPQLIVRDSTQRNGGPPPDPALELPPLPPAPLPPAPLPPAPLPPAPLPPAPLPPAPLPPVPPPVPPPAPPVDAPPEPPTPPAPPVDAPAPPLPAPPRPADPPLPPLPLVPPAPPDAPPVPVTPLPVEILNVPSTGREAT